MRRLFICSAVRRVYPGEDPRDIWTYYFGGGRGTSGEPYLLSGKNDQSDQTGERIHGGLAEDGGLPSGADLPGGFVEIHPFQGKKKDAEGIFGCDR